MKKPKLKSVLQKFQQKHQPPPQKVKENVQKDIKKHKESKYKFPFKKNDKILLFGEANFSFTRALIRHFLKEGQRVEGVKINEVQDEEKIYTFHEKKLVPEIIATTFDSEEITIEKYPDLKKIVEEIDTNATLLYNIDCTKPNSQLPEASFDKIVFNFPHIGKGIKDTKRNIHENQKLIQKFFQNAFFLLKQNQQSQILVTLKQSEPYQEWNVKQLARNCGLQCLTSFQFKASEWDGYAHRRTLGFQEGLNDDQNQEIQNARTFVFGIKQDSHSENDKKRKRKYDDSDSE